MRGGISYKASITFKLGFQRVKAKRSMMTISRKKVLGLIMAAASLFVLAESGQAQAPPFSFPAFQDNFASRQLISGSTNYVTGTNTSYTKEPGEPKNADGTGTHSAWLSWLAPDAGRCIMDTFGSGFNTVLAVYTGDSVSNLSLVEDNDDAGGTSQSQVSFGTTAGTAYQISVDGFGTNDTGSIVFHLGFSPLQPTILVPPQSLRVVPGSNATFTVTAQGDPPLGYQWLFGSDPLPNATNASLTIPNAQPMNDGLYRVIVSNGRGAVTSAVVTLRILLPPSITSQPRSQEVIAGTDAALNVGARGAPALGYQWRRGDTNLAGATAASLVITNTQFSNAGSYTVVVTNAYGAATSAVASLTVKYSLTVFTIGNGMVTVNAAQPKPVYNFADQVALTATPGRWFGFTRWGDGPTENPRVITIATNNNYTAIFSATTAVEMLTFSNVSRIAPVGMPAIFVDGGFVATGAVTRLDSALVSMLTTFPNGSIFYTLDGSTPDFGTKLYSGQFVLRRSATVRAVAYDANFLKTWEADSVTVIIEPTFAITASTTGGGTVSLWPAAASYRSNTLVTLTARPAPGWTFLQWLGDATGTSVLTSVPVLSRDLCVQALFGTTLGTSVTGNGAVVADPAAAVYPYGTAVRLTAVPQSGNYFGAWGNAAMSANNPLLLPVTSAGPTVSCVFGPLSAGQVALTVAVNGRGHVTTSPRGNRFLISQAVMLTATPDADQDFLSWTGDASGTSTNLTVVLAQSKVITAQFTKRPRLSVGSCLGGWRESGFQLTLDGEMGGRYRIEQSSGLMDWSALGSFTNQYGIWQGIDAAPNDTRRFYRALEER